MGSARLALATAAGSIAGAISRSLGRGRGETLSGRVILTIYPDALAQLAHGRDVVLISGTNGKTTTTRALAQLLTSHLGESIATSNSGANMAAGITAALARTPRSRVAVLECDELYLPSICRQLSPRVVLLLNLSRDQLHRTAEVRKVAHNWRESLPAHGTTYVIDRDDPFLEYSVGELDHVRRVTFGGRRHADAATCPQCAAILDWSSGDYRCVCGLGSQLADIRGDHTLSGPARNVVLAVEAARLMGAQVGVDEQVQLTSQAPDRIEQVVIAGHAVTMRLAKNPESWRSALAAVKSRTVVLAVNARGIDGRDTSWLWDVDYGPIIGRHVMCTGDRRLDVAYRVSVQQAQASPHGATVGVADTVQDAVVAAATTSGPIELIASYTAFQDVLSLADGIKSRSGGR